MAQFFFSVNDHNYNAEQKPNSFLFFPHLFLLVGGYLLYNIVVEIL